MSHGYAVIDGNGIEFGCKASEPFDLLLHSLAYFMKMGVPGHKLCERIDHSYHRTTYHLLFHAVGTPQRPCAGHTSTRRAGIAAQPVAEVMMFHFADCVYV